MIIMGEPLELPRPMAWDDSLESKQIAELYTGLYEDLSGEAVERFRQSDSDKSIEGHLYSIIFYEDMANYTHLSEESMTKLERHSAKNLMQMKMEDFKRSPESFHYSNKYQLSVTRKQIYENLSKALKRSHEDLTGNKVGGDV